MSRATLYSQNLCHVSVSMIRLVCSIALVRVAKAGSLSYLFPSCVHRGAQEPAVETGSIVRPLYSTTLENPFVASFILLPNRYSSLASPARFVYRLQTSLVKCHLYGFTEHRGATVLADLHLIAKAERWPSKDEQNEFSKERTSYLRSLGDKLNQIPGASSDLRKMPQPSVSNPNHRTSHPE
jgi:hypothetical protein